MSIDSTVLDSKPPVVLRRAKNPKRKRKRQRKPKPSRSLTAALRGTITGAEIRAKIAANRAKRLAIADAMKREAGVRGHTVHKEDFSGLAYIGTGRILSPEGRKITQLYILAHECGHIFLQDSGEGYWLPAHVKELEAESYAHQAFREHGMTLPRRLSDWGRRYVGEWIEKDRVAGIGIDPRAEAYAAGRRSPYEPLRMVPATWRIFKGLSRVPIGTRTRLRLTTFLPERLVAEAALILRMVAGSALHGTTVCMVALGIFLAHHPLPEIFPKPPGEVTGLEMLAGLCGGLLIANLAVIVRTMVRR
jgi:hypothetical protein